jgi:hypothetical protein
VLQTQPPPGLPLATDPSSRAADLVALSSVTVAALLSLIGLVLGFAALLGTPGSEIFSIGTSQMGTTVTPNQSGVELFGFLTIVGTLLTVLELIYYRGAFRTLEPYDARFSTPAKLVLMLLIAIPILLLSSLALLGILYQAIVCAGVGNTIPLSCINSGALLGLLAVVVIVAIIAVIGYIGLLLGIWRLGSRYDSTALKVAAILLIIPLLNIVAAILILVSARSTRDEIARGGSPSTFD